MRIPLLAPLVLCAGCSNASWIPDDLDRDAALSAVGAAGYQRLCSAFDSYVREEYAGNYFVQAVCLAHGVTSTDDAQACADTVQSCTQTLPGPAESVLNQILDQASCQRLNIDPTGCSATVAQVSACLEAMESGMKNVQFELTCAAAGQSIDPNWWQVQLPAECEAIRAICPI